jgi:hypothetical protein
MREMPAAFHIGTGRKCRDLTGLGLNLKAIEPVEGGCYCPVVSGQDGNQFFDRQSSARSAFETMDLPSAYVCSALNQSVPQLAQLRSACVVGDH